MGNTFLTYERFHLRLPHSAPTTDIEHAENWRAFERWANTRPGVSVFFGVWNGRPEGV
jgi:hypothetical protein